MAKPFLTALSFSQQQEKTLDDDRLKLVCGQTRLFDDENQINHMFILKSPGSGGTNLCTVPCYGIEACGWTKLLPACWSRTAELLDYLTVFFMRAYGKLPYAQDNYIELTPRIPAEA